MKRHPFVRPLAAALWCGAVLGCAGARSPANEIAPKSATLWPSELRLLADLRQLPAGNDGRAQFAFEASTLLFEKRPDFRTGDVQRLNPAAEIFSAAAKGGATVRLTHSPGYDGEASVCSRDGSVVFTSARDGDLDLYRMNKDGGHVRRLTRAPGYDGGAVFNRDCSKIAWHASRPWGADLDEHRALLTQNLLRPEPMEIWTANADGSEARQVTYLNAASFTPVFHPHTDAILFASTHGHANRREVDIWAVRASGAGLTQVTDAPGFDGNPEVSPDGDWLAFSSERAATSEGHDTEVFMGRWRGIGLAGAEPADRIAADVTFLAAPARAGRGLGTDGLATAGAFLEDRLRTLGYEPAGDDGGYRQRFAVVTSIATGRETFLELGGRAVPRSQMSVPGFSASARAQGSVVFAGYGLVDAATGRDDYAGLNVKRKVVVVRRFAPESLEPTARVRLGDVRNKARLAKEKGASALLLVDWPTPPSPSGSWPPPREAPLPPTQPEGTQDVGLPVLMLERAALDPVRDALEGGHGHGRVTARLLVKLNRRTNEAFNVVGRLPAAQPDDNDGLLLGAHYDHLGEGARHSLSSSGPAIHPGADDNASGTATLLELARALAQRRSDLRHDVTVAFFSGEEEGLLGSSHFVRERRSAVERLRAMLNFDMVGRLRDNQVDVLGGETASEWRTLVPSACLEAGLSCRIAGDGQGPSDQAPFLGAGVPVLHFFTGTHSDYHRPSDIAERVNAAGAAAIARAADNVVRVLDVGPRLTLQKGQPALLSAGGDARGFGAPRR